MEYATFTAVLVIVSFVSWCVGVRMGAMYTARRIVEEFDR
jgi:hypothetical protein